MSKLGDNFGQALETLKSSILSAQIITPGRAAVTPAPVVNITGTQSSSSAFSGSPLWELGAHCLETEEWAGRAGSALAENLVYVLKTGYDLRAPLPICSSSGVLGLLEGAWYVQCGVGTCMQDGHCGTGVKTQGHVSFTRQQPSSAMR